MLRTLTLLLLVALLRTPHARAETAFIMVPAVETESIPPDVQRAVLAATMKALRDQGFSPVSLEDAERKAGACAEHECVADSLDKLHADFGVRISMMATFEEAAGLGSVGVEFHERELVYEGASVRVMDHGIERAVDETVAAARRTRSRGPGPWLEVHGSPHDVALYVEGARIDDHSLPCDVLVRPNQILKVTARRQGYRAKDYHVPIGSDRASVYKLQVALALESEAAHRSPSTELPSGASAPEGADVERVLEAQLELSGKATSRAATLRQQRTWADWTLGLAGVAVGAAYFFDGLRMTWRAGDCAEYGLRDGQLACRERYAVTTGAKLRMIGGALGMAAGTAVAWAAPIGWMYHRDHRGTVAGLTYKGDF